MTFQPSEQDGTVTFDVVVTPRASRERIGGVRGDRLCIAVTAPPADGAANDATTALLARALRVPRSAVVIARGASSRKKTLRVRGVSRAQVLNLSEEP